MAEKDGQPARCGLQTASFYELINTVDNLDSGLNISSLRVDPDIIAEVSEEVEFTAEDCGLSEKAVERIQEPIEGGDASQVDVEKVKRRLTQALADKGNVLAD